MPIFTAVKGFLLSCSAFSRFLEEKEEGAKEVVSQKNYLSLRNKLRTKRPKYIFTQRADPTLPFTLLYLPRTRGLQRAYPALSCESFVF
jgi:hypothetical protein